MSILEAPVREKLTAVQHRERLSRVSRLSLLRDDGLLESASTVAFDRLTRLATRLLGVPISLVTLVDDRRQRFMGVTGLSGWAGEARATPLTHSFCQHVVAQNATLVVTNASRDSLVRNNLGFKDLGIVAYLGVPLRTSDGEVLGAMSVIDGAPREWTTEQLEMLADLADAAMAEVDRRLMHSELESTRERLRQQLIRDPLTGLLNRRGFVEQARHHLAVAERRGSAFLVAAVSLDGFRQINDVFGRDAGDQALIDVAELLTDTCRRADIIGRIGGDEFVLLLSDADVLERGIVEERLMQAVQERNADPRSALALTMSVGFASWSSEFPMTLPSLLRCADDAMYEQKRLRRSSVG